MYRINIEQDNDVVFSVSDNDKMFVISEAVNYLFECAEKDFKNIELTTPKTCVNIIT